MTVIYNFHLFILLLCSIHSRISCFIVINTWDFHNATNKAASLLTSGSSAVDAIVGGCSVCEEYGQCASSVGWGGSPDEHGETTLDAMIMDGFSHDVGAVGSLRRVRSAIAVALSVMKHTTHTLLVGSQATEFAEEMGFTLNNMTSNSSSHQWQSWKANKCQPNYRQNVMPDSKTSCGPYQPMITSVFNQHPRLSPAVNYDNHDTIGMISIDSKGKIASGTTTNGLTFKVPGRVGDSPVAGAGSYADQRYGAAAATGDGDVMMRFLPSFHAVLMVGHGMSPSDAAKSVITDIAHYYPSYSGAIIVLSLNQEYGAACYGFDEFPFCINNGTTTNIEKVKCLTSL